MSYITETAEGISRWSGLGVNLPEDLARAVADYELIKWTEVGRRPAFELDGLTAENVEARLGVYAQHLALGSSAGPGLSALEQAKANALEDAATQVRNHAVHALQSVIDQLQPQLADLAEAYCAAVAKLPEDLTSDTLVNAGPAAVEAFSEAQTLAGRIDRLDGWVASTARLTSGRVDPVLRLLTPSDIGQLTRLDAAQATPAFGALRAVDPLWLTAARLGIPFEIHTTSEANQIRKGLTTARPIAS